jgi:hypothetical protein
MDYLEHHEDLVAAGRQMNESPPPFPTDKPRPRSSLKSSSHKSRAHRTRHVTRGSYIESEIEGERMKFSCFNSSAPCARLKTMQAIYCGLS